MNTTVFLVVGIVFGVILFIGILSSIMKMYRKALQGEALVKTGMGGTKVNFNGMFVLPVIHKLEVMDITLKTIVTARTGKDGLICKDNMRADIKVTFFMRVNQTHEDVKQVAQSIGCHRASDQQEIENLFDAKFSEALKTVGKQFDFVSLYDSRDDFKREILNIIGTDLNGYVLDDCAIDYLEQTPLESLNENNILDAEGIKKIIDLTADQKMQANLITREKEKTIKKQDVEARETILELERQQAEAEAKQKREIETVQSREEAEAGKVREEERLKSERARITTEEELMVAEENKLREVVVAQKNKERTEVVETERVKQAQMLEATERERVVALKQIEKEKAVEQERRDIQDVIRERVAIQKTVVEEEELTKDIKANAEADRTKKVAITLAEKDAEESLVKEIKSAEAKKQASEHLAKHMLIDAQAEETAAVHKAAAKKTMAEAQAAEEAALGMAEAQVMEAKAASREKQGDAEASVVEAQAEAEAKGIRMKGLAQAEADEKIGVAEAKVMSEKFTADADGIRQKAEAMKILDGVSKDHEEFKLTLEKDKEIELAHISIQKDIAEAQAQVISEALRAANIEIVGGETMFFDQIMGAVTKGKSADRLISSSHVLNDVMDTFFNTENGASFKDKLRSFVDQFGISSDELRNLSVSALLLKLGSQASDEKSQGILGQLTTLAEGLGIGNKSAGELGL